MFISEYGTYTWSPFSSIMLTIWYLAEKKMVLIVYPTIRDSSIYLPDVFTFLRSQLIVEHDNVLLPWIGHIVQVHYDDVDKGISNVILLSSDKINDISSIIVSSTFIGISS